jgi:peptidoglycan hydrolase-like protein with peptidoglycan-binding domain
MKRMLVLTSPHMKGDDVTYAQNLLRNRGGYYKGKSEGEFGPLTAQACYRAKYWLGYAKPTQTFGTDLEKLLLGRTQPSPAAKQRIAGRKKAQANPLSQNALAQMEKFVGLAEEPAGSNRVPEINSWWGGGNVAWCARCVSKAYVTAGSKAFVRGRNYEYVPTLVGDARAGRNGLTVTLDPKPGDLVCFDWDGSNFHSGDNHVGMFKSGNKQRFKTIEGNVDSCCGYQDRTAGSAKHVVFVHVGK